MSKISILTLGTQFQAPAAGAVIDWGAENALDGTSRWAASPNPARITCGADLDGEVGEVIAFLQGATVTLDRNVSQLRKNGTAIAQTTSAFHTNDFHALRSGVLQFSTGDYFDIHTQKIGGADFYWDDNETNMALVTMDRLGFVHADLTADTTTTGEMAWTPTLDTLETYAEPGDFIAPAGCVAAIVSLNNFDSAGPRKNAVFFARVNGTDVRTADFHVLSTRSYSQGPLDFGVIPITVGQILDVRWNGVALQAANCSLGIEWISAA